MHSEGPLADTARQFGCCSLKRMLRATAGRIYAETTACGHPPRLRFFVPQEGCGSLGFQRVQDSGLKTNSRIQHQRQSKSNLSRSSTKRTLQRPSRLSTTWVCTRACCEAFTRTISSMGFSRIDVFDDFERAGEQTLYSGKTGTGLSAPQ